MLGRSLHQSWCVVWLCVGIIAGVVVGLVGRVNYLASGWFVVLGVMLLMVSMMWPRVLMMALAVMAGLMMSLVRVGGELTGENYVRGLMGQIVVVSGKVSGDPQTDEAGTRLKVVDLRFGEGCEVGDDTDVGGSLGGDGNGICQASAGSIYVSLTRDEEIRRGDLVMLGGKMGEGFGTYVGYMHRPKLIRHLKPEPGDVVLAIRDGFAERIESEIPEPEVRLGLSYLLGMKAGLPDELSEQLRVVGLTHIVVASGAHLSILVEVARKIFGRVSRFAGLLFSLIFILFFMAMVGWTPSILRAGVMTSLTLLAWYSGRKIAAWRLILMVAAGTLMLNPMFVVDLGWLLSFASYAGIMILGPRVTEFFYGARKPGSIGGMVLTTFAATIMTLPIVLYYYGQVSLISVVANLLILPTLSVAMGLVFLTGVVAGVPVVGGAVGWGATRLLDFHITVVSWLGEMRQFLVTIPAEQVGVFALYIAVAVLLLVGKVVKLREGNKNRSNFMSGHSKWATTKRQKAVVDAKRGALFTKIGNQIAIAARAGTDPAMNPSLAMVLEKARLANMPKANIERAIARVADKSAAALIEEVYEAYGPGGVGIVIEVATDNKNRTMPEVRHTLDKNGGRMADPGSVMFQFARKGVIEISEKGDEAVMAALEAGAEDASEDDEATVIYTAASDLMKVRQALVDAGMTVTSAELQYVPNSYVPVEGESAEKLEKLLGAIDDLDDVVNTYTNAE